MTFSVSFERRWQSGVDGSAKVPKRIKLPQWDSNPGPPSRQSKALTHSATAPPMCCFSSVDFNPTYAETCASSVCLAYMICDFEDGCEMVMQRQRIFKVQVIKLGQDHPLNSISVPPSFCFHDPVYGLKENKW